MKFLITGGTGFIGKELCQALLEKHHEITVSFSQSVHRNDSTIAEGNICKNSRRQGKDNP